VFYAISDIIIEANIGNPTNATLERMIRTIVALCLLSTQVLVTKQLSYFYQLLSLVFICENFIMTLGIGVEILDALVQALNTKSYPCILKRHLK
jgi:uncharacterized membrane protein